MESEFFAYLESRFSDIVYGTIAIVVLLEVLAPRRVPQYRLTVRWASNFTIGLCNSVLHNWVLSVAGIGVALSVGHYEWALLTVVPLPPAIEILINTPHIGDLILKGNISDLKEAMEQSGAKGMQTFDMALFELFKEERIDLEEALSNADSRTNLEARINFG